MTNNADDSSIFKFVENFDKKPMKGKADSFAIGDKNPKSFKEEPKQRQAARSVSKYRLFVVLILIITSVEFV